MASPTLSRCGSCCLLPSAGFEGWVCAVTLRARVLVAAAIVGASSGRRVVGKTVACWQASLRFDWALPVGLTTAKGLDV